MATLLQRIQLVAALVASGLGPWGAAACGDSREGCLEGADGVRIQILDVPGGSACAVPSLYITTINATDGSSTTNFSGCETIVGGVVAGRGATYYVVVHAPGPYRPGVLGPLFLTCSTTGSLTMQLEAE